MSGEKDNALMMGMASIFDVARMNGRARERHLTFDDFFYFLNHLLREGIASISFV